MPVTFINKDNPGFQTTEKLDVSLEHVVQIEQKNLQSVVEVICQQCRYPLLAVRILIYVICGIDAHGRIHINARQLSQKLGVHYDTLTKCLKYLREINVLSIEK